MAICLTSTSLPEGRVKSRLNICEMVRPDIRPLYLLLVELETDFVAIKVNVVGDLESPPNS